ncbi:MAG: DMT family transporter [Victivallales bacterium]|nr:DMT family transporter [Victivallales bacterium]
MNRFQANICLVCVTLYWSLEVILYACIPSKVAPFSTACVTSLVGSFLIFAAFPSRMLAECRKHGKSFLGKCFAVAILSATYNTMFLNGLKSFDVASGAFTFCMTVVVLPVILLTARRKVNLETWLSATMVLAGIVIVLGPTLDGWQLPGLLLMGGGCLLRALCIIEVTDLAKDYDPLCLAFFPEFFAGLFSLFGWYCSDHGLLFTLPWSRNLVAVWVVYAFVIVAIAQVFNIYALKHLTAANATVVYSVEILFSLFWGVVLPSSLIQQTKLTPLLLLGALLVFLGSLIEIVDLRNLPWWRRAKHSGDSK